MADIETTLKTRTNQDNVFPNIRSNNIPSGAVTHDKVAVGAIDTNNILDGAVDEDKLAHASVGTNQLVDGSVTIDKMTDGSVGTDQLVSECVTHDKLGPACVWSDNITQEDVKFQHLTYDNVDLATLYTRMGDFEDFYQACAIMGRDWRYKLTYYDINNDHTYPCFLAFDGDNAVIKFIYFDLTGTAHVISWDENSVPSEASGIVVYSSSSEAFLFD